MSKRFNSYLLRFWDRADGERRIDIEHIQEGARTVVDSTVAAMRWIDARAAAPTAGAQGNDPDPTRSTSPGNGMTPRQNDEDDGQDAG